MPRLSDSMEEGTIVRWLKHDGEQVTRGEELVEIETDKATMTYEADADGVLAIVAQEGDTLPIGAVIASLGGDGDAPAPAAEAAPAAREERATAAPARAAAPARDGNADGGGRLKASPVARRMADELGIELRSLSGTGPGGRIVKADVEAANDRPGGEATAPPADPVAASGRGETTIRELTRTQQIIARRMAESRATVPDFTLTTQVDMERAVEQRRQLKDLARDGHAPSYNDMIVKACALALREFPRANGSYKDGQFALHERVNVGVAVAAEDALIVPTVFDADVRPLEQIAVATRELAEKVRAATITPPELSGATFTVSNLGMYGITSFTAVINPPQAAILAVGAIELRAVVQDGTVVSRHRMTMTLSCDHRILYGAPAGQFLARIRELLEHPVALVG
ncbi:MAG TPA: dihydrolipoamide acetyltransferase family protein [Solirubrobacteraceae bacterium]|nr:dihydrolipoamide acetyltransferase family protein [Solirubrobacteraceae bacterium]